ADRFSAYGKFTSLRTAVVYGGVNQDRQVRQLTKGIDILVATPGRLLDLMNQGHLHLRDVAMLVLDEADRMLDMGFLPAIKKIVGHLPPNRQTLLFSATMPEAMSRLAASILRQPVKITIEPVRQTTELVEQQLYFVPKQAKMAVLMSVLEEQRSERSLVFTRTKHGADRLAKCLVKAGIATAAMHGNKNQNQRTRILEAFRSGTVPILIATDVAARGIDVEAISHVVNFDLPQEPETYIHRIGRTGRAGATGIAITLCDQDERGLLRDIERRLGQPIPRHGTPEVAGVGSIKESTGAPRESSQGTRKLDRPPAKTPTHGSKRNRSWKAQVPGDTRRMPVGVSV
ncbi:MAG TPA: DEAD/DEAH box helicase, partial [Pirellulaceae bacterium]